MNNQQIEQLIVDAHTNSKAHGFWDPPGDDIALKLALIHSEISEALEEWRARHDDSELSTIFYEYKADNGGTFRRTTPTLDIEKGKPAGFAIEIADVVIRIGDLLGYVKALEIAPLEVLFPNVSARLLPFPELIGQHLNAVHDAISAASKPADGENAAAATRAAVYRLGEAFRLCENILDMFPTEAGAVKLFDAAVTIKMAYNLSRPHMHGKRA